MDFLISFFTTNTGEIELKKIVTTILVAIITSTLSIITSIITTIMNSNRTKKTTYINTITSNRIKWMQELKELIDRVIRKTQVNNYSPIYNDEKEKIQYFDELSSIRNKVFLHLNYKGYIDDKIMIKVNALYRRIELIYEIDSLFKIKDADEKINYFLKHYHKDIFDQLLEVAEINSDNRNKIIDYLEKNKELPQPLEELINKQIKKFNDKFRGAPRKIANEIQDIHNELLMLVQIYLKLEWDRVKDESISKLGSYDKEKYSVLVEKMIREYDLKLYDYSLDKLPDYLR